MVASASFTSLSNPKICPTCPKRNAANIIKVINEEHIINTAINVNAIITS